MIPISDAIETGVWLQADYSAHYCDAKTKQMSVRIKPREFSKVDLKSISEPELLQVLNVESNLWVLKAEVVSLFKEELYLMILIDNLRLVDNQGYAFNTTYDLHLLMSDLGRSIGFDKSEPTARLPPKIRRRYSFIFELPDFFDELFLAVKGGNIVEV